MRNTLACINLLLMKNTPFRYLVQIGAIIFFTTTLSVSGNTYTLINCLIDNHLQDTTKILEYKNNKSFNDFWVEFRKAILDQDTSEIIKNCIFPLETKGPMDEDSIIKFSKNQFDKLFYGYLNQLSGLNPDDFNETELDYISNTPDIFAQHLNKFSMFQADTKARIGGMVFKNINGFWYLYFLYLEYSTYKSLEYDVE